MDNPADVYAYNTPLVVPSDPIVCHSIALPVSAWEALFGHIGLLSNGNQWARRDIAAMTVADTVAMFSEALDSAIFRGCTMIGDIKYIARDLQEFEILCDGAAYQRVDFPELYAALHPNYHLDADNFVVPNLIDRFPLGSTSPNVQGGNASVTLSEANLAAHTHTTSEAIGTGLAVAPGELPLALPSIASVTGSAGSGTPIDIRNPYQTLIPVIVATVPHA